MLKLVTGHAGVYRNEMADKWPKNQMLHFLIGPKPVNGESSPPCLEPQNLKKIAKLQTLVAIVQNTEGLCEKQGNNLQGIWNHWNKL